MSATWQLPIVALDLNISRSTLRSCVQQVKLYGYEILYQQIYRGKSSSSMRRVKPTTPVTSTPETELEFLRTEHTRCQRENARLHAENARLQAESAPCQTENAYLRVENALLKKVKALVEEQEARRRAGWRKPSKD